MSDTLKPKSKPTLRGHQEAPVAKSKPRLTGAFRHFQDELKQLGQQSKQSTQKEPIITPAKGELVFDDGAEVTDLARQLQSGTSGLVELNALNLEPWSFANRSQDALFLEELNRDMDTAGGQKSPVLVRKLATPRPSSSDPEQTITHEVIAGRRRWEAVRRRENKTLICLVRELSDQQAALEQEMENRRKDPSNYDDARTYKRYLDSGLYPSQQALCEHLGIEKTKLSQLMNYNKLPDSVAQALEPMHKISLHSVRILRQWTTHQSEEIRGQCITWVLDNCVRIREGKLAYKQLEAAFQKLTQPPRPSDIKRAVTSKGTKVCSIRKAPDGRITIAFESSQLQTFLDEEIRRDINEVLEEICKN